MMAVCQGGHMLATLAQWQVQHAITTIAFYLYSWVSLDSE